MRLTRAGDAEATEADGACPMAEMRRPVRVTRSLSMRLLSGPFHWMISFPRSSRKTSPLLKLFQDIST